MTIVLDANVLLRIADKASTLHPVAMAARTALENQGHTLHRSASSGSPPPGRRRTTASS